MNLEQIVKETVAKIVAEKGKDLTGPKGIPDGKIDSADYLKARSNAIEKAKGLDEAANKIKIIHKGPSDDPTSNYMQYELLFNGDEINAEEFAKGWKVIRYDDWDDEYKDIRNPKKQEIIDFINAYNEKNLDNIKEEEDHEVSMAQRSLNSILRSAMELKAKIGNQEINIPAWIQDHITNSENFIDQASQGYHEYSNGGEHGEMDEARFEKGTDIGGKGFEFKDIAKKAAKQYGSKEAGQRVAGAIMKKVLNKEGNLNHNEVSSIEQEGRFWIVTYNTADGTKEKSFESEDEARKFYNGLDEAQESNDDKIAKYEKYTYTLDGETVKPEITFLNNILKAMIGNKIYNVGAPENGKVELTPESGKKGTYSESTELDEYVIRRWQHYAGIE
jgi:hypothetical protein